MEVLLKNELNAVEEKPVDKVDGMFERELKSVVEELCVEKVGVVVRFVLTRVEQLDTATRVVGVVVEIDVVFEVYPDDAGCGVILLLEVLVEERGTSLEVTSPDRVVLDPVALVEGLIDVDLGSLVEGVWGASVVECVVSDDSGGLVRLLVDNDSGPTVDGPVDVNCW